MSLRVLRYAHVARHFDHHTSSEASRGNPIEHTGRGRRVRRLFGSPFGRPPTLGNGTCNGDGDGYVNSTMEGDIDESHAPSVGPSNHAAAELCDVHHSIANACETCVEYASPPAFSPSSSLSISRSPDTASPIYPERAIRPLPKSRLKSKLSPQQVSTIVYPPDPPPVSPTLHFSTHDGVPHATSTTNGDVVHGHYLHHHPRDARSDIAVHDHCTCGEGGDSGDEEVEFDHPDYRYATPSANGIGGGRVLDNVQQRLMDAARMPGKPPPPASTGSSGDGYESFENTSNKKKRKIPLSSASSMHQSQLSAEMASMGISGSVDGAADDMYCGAVTAVPQRYVAAAAAAAAGAGTGISGAGRGRYGRQSGRNDHGVRRPLASSSMSAINGYSSRLPVRSGGDLKSAADTGIENTGGIISQAIKSAAEQGPLTPQKGQQTTSLLQSATTSSTPTNSKTQFTFAVESESANKMADQQAAVTAAARNAYMASQQSGHGMNGGRGGVSTQGTQTTPSLRGGNPPVNNAGNPLRQTASNSGSQQQPPQQAGQAPAPKPKPRRRPSKEYALAARQRKLQQEYANYHHRPTKDNMWICEFCEYEDIFGTPPVALIRQYEIKDRQERKRAAEKRRLLEKAKAKNRKGKKGGKKGNNANNANATAATSAAGVGGQNYDPNLPLPDNDDYYDDDEYPDEYDPVGPDGTYPAEYYAPPVPAGTPQGNAALPGGGHKPGG